MRVRDADYPLLTSRELAATGQALFGPAWRAALAHAFAVTEADITAVERGQPAPREWRPKLIALAQETAVKALEAASNLLWRESSAYQALQSAAAAPRLA